MEPRHYGWLGLGVVGMALLVAPLWRLTQAAQLARDSRAYQQAPPAAVQRLLVVGDSTAVGTGASAPAHSLVGLIGQAHPRLHIDNRARDGATFDELKPQLQGSGSYDLVLVLAGGNDVIRLRDLDQVAQDIDRVLALAGERGEQVIVMPAGNVGNAPALFPPLSWWMSHRSRVLHGHVEAAAQRRGAVYVDLYVPAAEDPFAQRLELNAADGLHPSDAGYLLWLQALRDQAGLQQRLAASAPG